MIPDWKKLSKEQKKIEAREMELYSAMIDNIDHHLGRLFKHLKKTGAYENTLVIFFSDNGANGTEMHQYPGTDEAWLDRNSDNRYENMGRRFSQDCDRVPAWAQVSMTPFRLFKAFTTEGGIRSPLIISGPGVVRPGSPQRCLCPRHGYLQLPFSMQRVLSTRGLPIRGAKWNPSVVATMMKVLNGNSKFIYDNDTAVNWEMLGFRAVRKGDFKLVWLLDSFWEVMIGSSMILQ